MKAGLEVHQQLATTKLFCPCPSELSEQVEGTVRRRLRATGGENRAFDPAARFESALGLSFVYEVVPTTCLVELDEEPPHAINAEALDVALTVSLLLHATPIDEILVMRKLVVDGSNTAGFQRTALVAVDGWIEVGGHRISIDTICLEEDAARKVSETGGEVRYRLDRLGIPLVEVATGPDLTSPEQVRDVAQAIGQLLRSTHRVRRGIGTIREDLNLSVPGGTRIEIKGVQELRLLPKYAEEEIARQEMLVHAKDELHRRQAHPPTGEPVDVSDLLRGAGTGPLDSTLKKGGVVLAVPLPGFHDLLGHPGRPGPRLGRELADYARVVGVRGILHSDELPSEAVGAAHVEQLRQRLALGKDDAFVPWRIPTPARRPRRFGRFCNERRPRSPASRRRPATRCRMAARDTRGRCPGPTGCIRKRTFPRCPSLRTTSRCWEVICRSAPRRVAYDSVSSTASPTRWPGSSCRKGTPIASRLWSAGATRSRSLSGY